MSLNRLTISVKNPDPLEDLQNQVKRELRKAHKIRPGQPDDFGIFNQEEALQNINQAMLVFKIVFYSIAGISLVVGGIGIMNIMLVSVTERTREIGIRLAIGALGREVMMQFLVESVVLSCFGGIVGILLGLSAAALGSVALKVPFVFQPGIVVIAFAFSSAVGIVFGYFPARKASNLDPIEALRHE